MILIEKLTNALQEASVQISRLLDDADDPVDSRTGDALVEIQDTLDRAQLEARQFEAAPSDCEIFELPLESYMDKRRQMAGKALNFLAPDALTIQFFELLWERQYYRFKLYGKA